MLSRSNLIRVNRPTNGPVIDRFRAPSVVVLSAFRRGPVFRLTSCFTPVNFFLSVGMPGIMLVSWWALRMLTLFAERVPLLLACGSLLQVCDKGRERAESVLWISKGKVRGDDDKIQPINRELESERS